MLDEERRSLTDTSRGRKSLCREERREEIRAGGKGEQDLFLGRPQLGHRSRRRETAVAAALWLKWHRNLDQDETGSVTGVRVGARCSRLD